MHRLRPHSPLFLLALLAIGGIVAPSVHRVQHAQEWAQTQRVHLDAAHHHHTAFDLHGTELAPPCPDAPAVDLACVLCHGVSSQLPALAAAVLPPLAVARLGGPSLQEGGAAHLGAHSIRGPPERVI